MHLLFFAPPPPFLDGERPKKNNPQPPRPGVSLYHTSQAHSSHAGISPTKGVGAAAPFFALPCLPF